jgi:uncharacterized protein YjbJ (UPF0337 family)
MFEQVQFSGSFLVASVSLPLPAHCDDPTKRNEPGSRNIVSACTFAAEKEAPTMDREHADKAKGSIEETAGKAMDDKELQSEGKVDKAKGDLHNAAGDVKDAARNLTK